MGSTLSSRDDLKSLNTKALVEVLESFGEDYRIYTDIVQDKEINGEKLDSCSNRDELKVLLNELGMKKPHVNLLSREITRLLTNIDKAERKAKRKLENVQNMPDKKKAKDADASEEMSPPMCPMGHDMVQSNNGEGDYSNGWNCDCCGEHCLPIETRWHCRFCYHDICFRCNDDGLEDEDVVYSP